MEYRTIGELQVSLAGLGCNNFGMRIDADQTQKVVDAAIEAGVNFFDTARMYGGGKSEEFLGQALGKRRGDVIIGTKFGMEGDEDNGGSLDYITRVVEIGLTALGTDYIDLYQFHRPDPNVPIEETIGALHGLVEAGKVRAIGHSNFTEDQIDAAEAASSASGQTRFVTAQNEWSLLNRAIEADVVPACERNNLGMLPYFPLASGMLTGKYRKDQERPADTRLTSSNYFDHFMSDANFDKVEALIVWGEAHDRTILEVACSWMASQPVVASVISGATKPEQVTSNAAATRGDLTADEIAEINAIVGL